MRDTVVDMIRRSWRGEQFVRASERFEIVASRSHDDVVAVLRAVRRPLRRQPARLTARRLTSCASSSASSMVLVGDRGVISAASIEQLRAQRFAWITALKGRQIRSLLKDGALQMGLFDECHLFELQHPDFPGERLVACRNPALAKRRAHKRTALLEATAGEFDKVRAMVVRGSLQGAAPSACVSARCSTNIRSPSTLNSPSTRPP
jgi:hypothetical protein